MQTSLVYTLISANIHIFPFLRHLLNIPFFLLLRIHLQKFIQSFVHDGTQQIRKTMNFHSLLNNFVFFIDHLLILCFFELILQLSQGINNFRPISLNKIDQNSQPRFQPRFLLKIIEHPNVLP